CGPPEDTAVTPVTSCVSRPVFANSSTKVRPWTPPVGSSSWRTNSKRHNASTPRSVPRTALDGGHGFHAVLRGEVFLYPGRRRCPREAPERRLTGAGIVTGLPEGSRAPVTRLSSSPSERTLLVFAVIPAVVRRRDIARRWRGRIRLTTLPWAPALAVRPPRCR